MIIGTALSEQSMDPDSDGLNNLNEFLLGGNPLEVDTDGDCIFDGNEEAFAQSVLRSPNIAMLSGDVDENGIPDGEQWGCDEITPTEPEENESVEEPDVETDEKDEEEGFLDIREDAMSRPGARVLFVLMALSAVALLISSWASFRRPRSETDEILVDDSGYRFDDSGSKLAILKGTSFDRDSADSRSSPEVRMMAYMVTLSLMDLDSIETGLPGMKSSGGSTLGRQWKRLGEISERKNDGNIYRRIHRRGN